MTSGASKESGHDAGYSDSETGEIENQLEEGEEENETDSEVDEERDDCSDLYPLGTHQRCLSKQTTLTVLFSNLSCPARDI